jgi:hypothetical protein
MTQVRIKSMNAETNLKYLFNRQAFGLWLGRKAEKLSWTRTIANHKKYFVMGAHLWLAGLLPTTSQW